MNKKKDGRYWEADPVCGLLYDHRATWLSIITGLDYWNGLLD